MEPELHTRNLPGGFPPNFLLMPTWTGIKYIHGTLSILHHHHKSPKYLFILKTIYIKYIFAIL
jgi:hypothetical protein